MKNVGLRSLTKKCSKCKETKSVEDFFKKTKRKCGLDSWCKQCCKLYMIKYVNKNKEKIALCNKQWQQNNKNKCWKF